MRRWWWVCGALLLGALVAGCSASVETGETVSRGLGAKDATADVKLLSFQRADVEGGVVRHVGRLLITNHTSGPSDYYIEVSIENKAGTQVDWANPTAEHVQPGQQARISFEVFDHPDAHRAVVREVQRTAAP
jgi:hypothetical protein